MFKNFIQRLFNLFGFKISSINKGKSNTRQYFSRIIDNINPVIFDVGANRGESIDEFKKYFPNAIFYCFEPNKSAKELLIKKYKNQKEINLNFFGLGSKNEEKEFISYKSSGHSSFVELNSDTLFINSRAKSFNSKPEDYINTTYKQEIKTLDFYCEKNNIKNIDILKIDVQGYEMDVLLGSKKMIQSNLIDLIEVEIVFSEVYKKTNNICDIENLLIPYGYKIFSTNTYGNLYTDYIWQTDLTYISNKKYEQVKHSGYFKSFPGYRK
tara:strand:+ start:769 stop:1572 length:804 start_codon:yes stop_codon:yes gene_type:complete